MFSTSVECVSHRWPISQHRHLNPSFDGADTCRVHGVTRTPQCAAMVTGASPATMEHMQVINRFSSSRGRRYEGVPVTTET
jgi:hypothetical protein